MFSLLLLVLVLSGCTKNVIPSEGALYCAGMRFDVTYVNNKYYLKGTNRRVITHAYNSICYVEN